MKKVIVVNGKQLEIFDSGMIKHIGKDSFLKPYNQYSNKQNTYKKVKIKDKVFYIHRLMGYAFLGLNLSDRWTTINHKDLNKTNNKLDNLEILTLGDNIRHYWKTKGEREWI